jgi:hypothetical protein
MGWQKVSVRVEECAIATENGPLWASEQAIMKIIEGAENIYPLSKNLHTAAFVAVQLDMLHLPQMPSPPLAGLAGAVDKR